MEIPSASDSARRVANASRSPSGCDTPDGGFRCNVSVSHFWGQYSPFFSVPSEIDAAVPPGCAITFAQVLSRHGARDPTLGKTIIYGALVERIRSSVTDFGADFAFLKDYRYALGADQLTAFGRQEMVNSGIKFYTRYRKLASTVTPFIRSAGQDRVVESALKWTQGFHAARLDDKRAVPDHFPYEMIIIPEGDGINNTLGHNLCPAFVASDKGSAQRMFAAVFTPPITARLNKGLPGANLTNADTISFMDLCPYDTVADDKAKLSSFCRLFTEDEWHSYDYYQSLGKWYGSGNGNPLGSTQGVGFVNELVARLTKQPVEDHTATNRTLDSSPVTFPLDAELYADFSHDNDMAGIFAALGLYHATTPLSNTTKQDATATQGYSASWTVPFGARMYVEKMACSGSPGELVRVLVNDRVIPLRGCSADSLGRCELDKFVDSLGFARSGGHWDRCFV